MMAMSISTNIQRTHGRGTAEATYRFGSFPAAHSAAGGSGLQRVLSDEARAHDPIDVAQIISVLVLHTMPLLRRAIHEVLHSDGGFEIVLSTDSRDEAISEAARLAPDVIVFDPCATGMGGRQLIDQFHRATRSSRVVIIAASDRRELFADSISAGANGFLDRSAEPEEIARMIKSVHAGSSMVSTALAHDVMAAIMMHDGGKTAHAPTKTNSANGNTLHLTDVEQDLVRLVADGPTDRQIADRIFVSTRTVQNHLSRVRRKTGATTRAQIVRWASEHLLL